MTSSETGITLLNRKRGNIKCQLTKMANALQKQTDLSIHELQAKLDVVLKLQDKFELLKNDYYGIANDTEYAEAEPSLNSLEDDLQDFEQRHHTLLHKYSTPSTNYKTDLETLGPDLNSSQIVGNSEPDSSSENARVSFHTNGNNSILINTAIVYVKDSEGIRQPLRAILDCASESSFISSRSAEALGLQKEKDFYMDDCLSGSSELTEFETLQMELKQLLQRGGMTLHKWCTNLSPTNAKEFPLDRNSEEIQVKTLGMIWNSYYHKRDFHLGQQALLNTVRLKYWPLGGRSIARRVVHECGMLQE
ncbi:uncharacterized protein TNCT_409841 [Trichonephila clavata]|uniref:Peptidase aspartic putative domain-containing protein n=1 Tax=Trichonephila clavata TaxID=2740835 RepID=A0A8X6GUW6_TRICU|nr:uncharacterized protein TNCT_409841 [Trichonephila clavata]